MRRGRASGSAQFITLNRALGNLAPVVPGFSDPVSEKLLPARWAARVAKARARLPRNAYPFWFRAMGIFNQFRTVVLDRAIEQGLPFNQLVVLGAGLVGRAWRLPRLGDVTVFEVDHPDTQSLKRQQTAGWTPLTKDLHFVPVDFTRDNLGHQLVANGYDAARTTFWLWEGVTTYLAPDVVAATFSLLGSISPPGSSLALTYMAKKNGRLPKSWFMALVGEPVRSAFDPPELSELARAGGWTTASDTGIDDWRRDLASGVALTPRQVGLQWQERIWVGRRG